LFLKLNNLNYEQYKFSLKFKDQEIENNYWIQKNRALLHNVKIGLLQSFLFWIIGAVIFYITNPIQYLNEVILIISAVFPIFIFMLTLLKKERFEKYTHTIAVISNFVAASIVLYIGHMLPNEIYPVMVALILVIFFGLYLYRINKISTIILVTYYSVTFLFLLTSSSGLKSIDFYIALLYNIIIPVFTITASHASEKKEREIYLYQLMINEERKHSDKLLLNILPFEIAMRLKKGELIIADNYDQCTVLFADIAGFTSLSNKLKPKKIVYLLNHIFSSIDEFTQQYQLEKIKTIGDEYMVVGGINSKESGVEEIANLAIEIQEFFKNDSIVHEFSLKIRIGFHTGPITAGVIGITKFSYDIWGDTVNVASRMESNSMVGKINVSQKSMKLLQSKFLFESRAPMNIKGKGMMNTFFLTSKIDNNT
jgi:adenylate cyclase